MSFSLIVYCSGSRHFLLREFPLLENLNGIRRESFGHISGVMAKEVAGMADLRTKMAQVAALADRYDLGDNSAEGRIIEGLVDVLRDVVFDVEDVSANQEELASYVEEIDSDLMRLEDSVYMDEEDDNGIFTDDLDDDLGDFSGDTDETLINIPVDSMDDEAEYVELECGVCHKDALYNADLFDEDDVQLSCPHCGAVVYDSDVDCVITEPDEDDESLAAMDDEWLPSSPSNWSYDER